MVWMNRIEGQARIARFCIFALLILNLSAITHQIDTHPEDHHTHHCQLFSHIGSGLIPSLPQLSFPFVDVTPDNTLWAEHHNTHVHRYAARAPPSFSNLM